MKQEPAHKTTAKIIAPFIWLGLMCAAFTGSSFFLLNSFSKVAQGKVLGLYTAKSPVISESSFKTQAVDSRTIKIEKIFEKFKCPLAGTGEYIVKTADEYKVPYWLIPAVSFQESSCGKKTPDVSGIEESYNAWGYGVWGGNVKVFGDWEAGVLAVTKYFGNNFFSKGITDPCEIMNIYTPPSNGSWCEGIKYFGDMIQNFESD
jgi:hypothetical protein